MKERAIEDWLRRAYRPGADCPPPETYLEHSLERLSAAEKSRVLDHAERCPACAAERELSRAYEPSSDEMHESRADVDYIVSRLQTPVGKGTTVVPLRKVRPPWSSGPARVWGWAAAAAVLLVAAGTVTVMRSPAPSLPPRPADSLMRGTRIEINEPTGTLETLPRVLSWQEAPGAASYRVRILQVDDTVLWEYTVADPEVEVPDEVSAQMHPAVTYFWEVEAMDPAEIQVARSERVEFRVKPGGGRR